MDKEKFKELQSERRKYEILLLQIDRQIDEIKSQCQHESVKHGEWYREVGYDKYGDGHLFYERLNICNDCGESWHESR